jgi:hypothetical protein
MTTYDCETITSVEDSESFYDDPEGARKLWADGFRPMHAHELKHHDQVAYVETMFEMSTNRHGVTTVEDVGEDEYGTIIVSTWDRGTVNVDECSECWVRRP